MKSNDDQFFIKKLKSHMNPGQHESFIAELEAIPQAQQKQVLTAPHTSSNYPKEDHSVMTRLCSMCRTLRLGGTETQQTENAEEKAQEMLTSALTILFPADTADDHTTLARTITIAPLDSTITITPDPNEENREKVLFSLPRWEYEVYTGPHDVTGQNNHPSMTVSHTMPYPYLCAWPQIVDRYNRYKQEKAAAQAAPSAPPAPSSSFTNSPRPPPNNPNYSSGLFQAGKPALLKPPPFPSKQQRH